MSQDWVRDSNNMVSFKKIKFLQKYTSIITGRHAPVYNIIIWKKLTKCTSNKRNFHNDFNQKYIFAGIIKK
jgi:hypothetical protein